MGVAMTRILLALSQPEARESWQEDLFPRFEVLEGEGHLEEPFDLILLDRPMLERLRERLEARREAERPALLPVLLLVSQDDLPALAPHWGHAVDDFVRTPPNEGELLARIEILLRVRQASLEGRADPPHLEEEYRPLLQAIPLPLVALDRQLRILFCNDAYADFVGRPPRSLLGHSIDVLFPHFKQTRSYAAYRRVLESGRPEQVRGRLRDRVIHAWVSPAPWGLLAVAEDITAHVVVRERLEDTQRCYQVLVESPSLGVVIVQEMRIVYANETFARISGYTVAELLALSPEEVAALVHPEDREAVWDRWRARLAGEESSPAYIFRVVRKDGEMRHLAIFASTVEMGGQPAVQGAVVDITRQVQLEERLRRHIAHLEALHQVDRAVLAARSTDDLVRAALGAVCQIVSCDGAGVVFLEEEGRMARVVALDSDLPLKLGTILATEGTEEGLALLRSGRPQVLEDLQSLPDLPPALEVLRQAGVRTYAAFPLLSEADDLVGALVVGFRQPAALEEGTVHLLEQVALQLSLGLRQACLTDALRRRLRERVALHAVADLVTRAADPDDLIERATPLIAEAMGVDNLGVILLDEAAGVLRPHRSHLLRPGGRALSLRLGEGIVGQVAQSGRPRRVPDVHQDPDYIPGDPRTRSELCVPMRTGERVLGVLNTESTAPAAYDEEDERFLTTIAGQLAGALERMRLFEETRRLKEFHESVVRNLADGVLLFNEEGCCTYANPAAGHILGCAPEDLVGQPWRALIPPEQLPLVPAGDLCPGEEPARHELDLRCPDGSGRTVLAGRTPYTEQGRVLGTLVVFTDITERRRAEEALRESKARYHSLFENVPVGLYRTTAEGRILDANSALLRMLGCGDLRDLARIAAAGLFVRPEDRERQRALLEAHGELPPFTMALRRCDDTVIWVEDRARAVREGRGRILYYEGSMVDITRRREAEEAVRRQVAYLESLNRVIAEAAAASGLKGLLNAVVEQVLQALEAEGGGIWVGKTQSLRNVPASVVRFCGRLAREAGLDLPGPVIVEDTAGVTPEEAVFPIVEKLRRSGVGALLTVPVLAEKERLGGVAVVSAEPRAWSAEAVAFLEGVGRQLGGAVQRLRLLERVQAQARQMKQVMEAAPEGILLLDREGRVLQANPPAQEALALLAGYGEGGEIVRLADRPLEDLLQPAPPGQPHELLWKERAFEVLSEGVRTGRKALGWVLLLRDVTEERKVQERVEQQGRLAAMGELAAGIAHDFNNVLQGIISFAELLRFRRDMPAEAGGPLDLICQLAERAAHMTRQILDFSRRSIAERRPLDLAAFLRDAEVLLRRTLPEMIRVVLEIAPGPAWVRANETQLQQVLLNLVTNARDVMPQGGRLEVRLVHLHLAEGEPPPCPEMPPGRWLCLSVHDTGTGIPPEVLPHIFEPFFTTKDRSRGTGLGLAQVHGIVKQHDGYIDVASQVGQGTTFFIYLPLLEQGQETAPVGETAPVTEVTEMGGRTVLLVEDEEVVLEAVRAGLERMGCRVLAAGNGREALALYDRRRDEMDLVLTDMVMPDMGGLELAQALWERDRDLPVVVMSGYPLEEMARQALSQGVLTWVQKPVDLRQLVQVFRKVLGSGGCPSPPDMV